MSRDNFTKGIRPDRPNRPQKKLVYVTQECPTCREDVKFVEDLLTLPNHSVVCHMCHTLFDPMTRKVISLSELPVERPEPMTREDFDKWQRGK